MLVKESISFERGGDPKEVLGIGDHVRIRNLKVRDIIVLKNDRFSSFNHRIAVIIDINMNLKREHLYFHGRTSGSFTNGYNTILFIRTAKKCKWAKFENEYYTL